MELLYLCEMIKRELKAPVTTDRVKAGNSEREDVILSCASIVGREDALLLTVLC